MVGGHNEPPHQTCPQVTIWCQTTELSLRKDILQAKERVKPKALVNPPCVSDVAETAIQNITAKIAKFQAHIAKARHMPLIAVHSFQKPHLPQMVRHPTLLALMDEASKHTQQICPTSRRRSPRTRRDKEGNIHRNHRPSKMTMVQAHSTIPGKQKWPASTTRATTAFLPTAPTTGTPAWSDCGPARPWHCHCAQTVGPITSATIQGQPNSDKSP